MINLTKKQSNKANRLLNIVNDGVPALISELNILDDKITNIEDALQALPAVIKGKDGKNGVPGRDYVLTEQDKRDIFKNIKDSWIDDAEVDIPSTIYYAFKPKDAFLNESQLIDIWNKANKK